MPHQNSDVSFKLFASKSFAGKYPANSPSRLGSYKISRVTFSKTNISKIKH